MLVQGQRSFSHEEFRRVVYTKYIQRPETMVRLHIQMAHYFARLPASDRKVRSRPTLQICSKALLPHSAPSQEGSNGYTGLREERNGRDFVLVCCIFLSSSCFVPMIRPFEKPTAVTVTCICCRWSASHITWRQLGAGTS